MFLHGFEQGGLHLGGGAVDFVGEEQVREDRALLRHEGAFLRIVDHRTDHVGGQEIGRERDALELESDRLGERFDGGGLGQPGDAFEEDVPARDHGDQHAVEQFLLADEDLVHLLAKRVHFAGLFPDDVGCLGDVCVHRALRLH